MLKSFFVGVALWFAMPSQAAQRDTALQTWLQGEVDAHPAVQAAQSRITAAQARLRAADKALFNPELELDIEDIDVQTRQIGISQQIDWGDQRGSRTRLAQLQRDINRLDYIETRHEVATQLLTALSDWHGARSVHELAQQRLELMTRFADLAKLRYQSGDLSQVEADLATLALSEARFQASIANTEYINSEQTLIALTGSDAPWPALLQRLPKLDPDSERLDALLQALPVVKRARLRVLAAQAAVGVASSAASVNPTIGVRGGKEGDASLIGFNLSIPLQLRNNFQAEIDAANADYIAAQNQARNDVRQARSRLHSALRAYQLSLDAWLAWRQSGERSLGKQIALLQRLWKAGELSTTDYLVQLKQALDTQASAWQQRSTMWRNWAEWLAASGRIEQWLKPSPLSDTTPRGDNTAAAGE